MTDQAVAQTQSATGPEPGLDYEVVVIGAGVAGIYQIKRLADMGVSATVLEANSDVGGTWYKNRYPGARFDSESYTYGYTFSEELLAEWHWTERFSPQPETLKYLQYVADKFNLRQHIQFDCYVESMRFDDESCHWTISLKDGRTITSRFVLSAMGVLSVPTMPSIKGMETFKGESFHPFDWPADPPSLEGKRVAIVGTGATAIQIIPEVAKQAAQLTVFQRRPNWAAPLNNTKISEQEMEEIRSRYDEIIQQCKRSPGGFEHEPDRRGFYNLTREERVELWDELYDGPGFGIWLQNFTEIFMDEEANAEFSDYIADRIRGRVNDPELAEKLIPKDHGFGIQRVPLETGYYEAYNQENVRLVDGIETPIEQVTPTGIQTSDEHLEFDIIVYATGFDAFTGAFDRINIEGSGGIKLKDKWIDGPETYLGLMVSGFPNLVILAGPQIAATNFPVAIETAVEWATPLLEHVWANGHTRFEATPEAERDWCNHVAAMYEPFLLRKAKSWITGYNSNLDGHEYGKMRYNVYNGGGPKYTSILNDAADNGYNGIAFT